jgi:hypothetical protein
MQSLPSLPITPLAMGLIFLAMVLAAGLSFLAARSSRRQGLVDSGPWWGALAVASGYVVAHVGVATPSFPPLDVHDRTPYLVIAAALVGAAIAGGRGVLWARVLGYLGLAILSYFVILGPVLGAGEYSEETIFKLATVAGVSLLAMLNVGLLDAPGRRLELWVALGLLAAGVGVTLRFSNFAVGLFLAGSLALVLLASIVASRGLPVGGGIPVAATVLTALIAEGSVYAFVLAAPGLILAGSPLILWLMRIGPLARLGPKTRVAIASGLILIPIGVAIGLAYAWRALEESGY